MKALLSKKDLTVARCMINGLTARETADKMGLSFRTIENKKAIMFKKLGVSSPITFIREVVRLNIDGVGDEFLYKNKTKKEVIKKEVNGSRVVGVIKRFLEKHK